MSEKRTEKVYVLVRNGKPQHENVCKKYFKEAEKILKKYGMKSSLTMYSSEDNARRGIYFPSGKTVYGILDKELFFMGFGLKCFEDTEAALQFITHGTIKPKSI